MNFIVCIDGMSDADLSMHGWRKVAEDDNFIIYRHDYLGEEQPVDRHGRKFLVIDDVNDAYSMNPGIVVIQGPK